ncbi:hypothetical protein SAMN05192553_103366 [Cyclobacterium xiamenense]|jgi:hypothetical protein|uniref:Lipoprotein n=1 Tax=Cyclobacterium xiamenense TaxID=1297121 RepID=A0A1H6Y208_9BACT|nr:DUF6567 family protein [Cyclobacterium xiamenense]SEJ34496.1 hypothetical protein SAMN05192553_103366 [Cyclobacterium xiamenense]
MKKTRTAIFGLALIFGLGSCGVNQAWILNQNQNNTQVNLGSNNFQVLGQVKGAAEVDYVLIFGGKNRRNLFNEAYSAMIEEADLNRGSRTLTNILTEEQIGGVPPFYYKRTITVSATVVEFTK